jgi:hypothetical protein
MEISNFRFTFRKHQSSNLGNIEIGITRDGAETIAGILWRFVCFESGEGCVFVLIFLFLKNKVDPLRYVTDSVLLHFEFRHK